MLIYPDHNWFANPSFLFSDQFGNTSHSFKNAVICRSFNNAISFWDVFASATSHLQYKRPCCGMGGWNDPTSVPPWEVGREALQRRDGIIINRPERHRGTACGAWFQNAEINIKIKRSHLNFTLLWDQYKNPKVWWLHHTFIMESKYKKGLVCALGPW